MISDKGRIVFFLATVGLAGIFFVAAVLVGHGLVISGHVYHDNVLFGIDASRNMMIFTEPGVHNLADLERSNVHPLFSLLIKPWARIIQGLGITKGTSAIIVNAAAAAIALLLAAWYFRQRRLDRIDAWLLTLLMGASSTWVCLSAFRDPTCSP